jgi:hypothetical protein
MSAEKIVSLESSYIKCEVSTEGSYKITDKVTGISWYSNPYIKRLGVATIKMKDKTLYFSLNKFEIHKADGSIRMKYRLDKEEIMLTINVKLLDDEKTLEFSYEIEEGLEVENIRLLEDGLWLTDAEDGYIIVPVREGLLIPSNSGRTFIHTFETFSYEGCHMEMLGIVKKKSAILITWHNPYVIAEVKSTLNSVAVQAKQILSLSLDLRKTAKAFRITFLGEGDYVTIARAYREIAKKKGWFMSWKQKIKEVPNAAKLIGASNFKLWSCLDRRLDYKMNEKSVAVNWTFEEAAKIAEHLKKDLKIEKALFIIGGWIRRGYDNQHPDILPAAPECGGNEALAEASKRVKNLGYLFCLHDNYQDIYRDSPSWSEGLIMKGPDGQLMKGGFWAGGQAWLICSKMGLELAKRPQNLPKVKGLFNPNAYFNDTTFAAGLYECYDPKHPLTKWDDMRWKQELCNYTISLFGVFGSECGREWAISCSHFFEGLAGVGGRYYHALNPESMGAHVIPLFEMVYRDCIAVYGKYEYDYSRAAEYVIHHIIIGRPLHYHTWNRGLYWEKASKDEPQGWPYDSSCFIQADNGWAEGLCMIDRFIKNTHEVLSPLHEITAETVITKHEYLTPDFRVERVVFGEDVDVVVNKASGEFGRIFGYKDYVYNSKIAGEVILPPYGFVIESPIFIAFHALSWNGIKYEKPVLFTIRSLDGKPISESGRIRVFHGFGESKIKIKGQIYNVPKEEVITF